MTMTRVLAGLLLTAMGCAAASDYQPVTQDLGVEGVPWVRTFTGPYDPARREDAYKVYAHLLDFEGELPITKGPGGKYPHHRGLFIGWRELSTGGAAHNAWSMNDTVQLHRNWRSIEAENSAARQVQEIDWIACPPGTVPGGNTPVLLREVRTIALAPLTGGMRQIDFTARLSAAEDTVRLRGDSHHAGMQIRMANEVSEHENSTVYLLPPAAERQDNDEVSGAWWVMGSFEVRDKRYWVLHMTPPTHPTGEPRYSTRPYGRFGAFFEADIEPGAPLTVSFRIILSPEPLDAERCQAFHDAYAAEAAP